MNPLNRFACALLAGSSVLLAGCWERPPIDTSQNGFRGTAMVQMSNPRVVEAGGGLVLPQPSSPPSPGGPSAGSAYKNVKVLNDLDVGSFTRLMVSMSNWIAPNESCAYCHKPGEDFSSDSLYTKVVARRMLTMTRHINTDWKNHVADTGVTCYTCHRGNPVPQQVWFTDPATLATLANAGNRYMQNAPSKAAGLASLPVDPFTTFLLQSGEIRMTGPDALPSGHKASIQHTEWTFSLMTHMSKGLGVNCTFCHNSRAFNDWEGSTPQRSTAWYGIRMVRDINVKFMEPLASSFPPERLGPLGDAPKANCATCHQGVSKPLGGAQLLADHPELGPRMATTTASASTGRKR